MRRVIGFAVFCMALGMIIAMLLPKVLMRTIVLLILLLVAYNLFCCE